MPLEKIKVLPDDKNPMPGGVVQRKVVRNKNESLPDDFGL